MLPLLGNILREVRDEAEDGDACTIKVFVDPSEEVVDFIEFLLSDM